MELHISDVSDWTLFNAIAAVMERELGGEWVVQADGLDQRYWDLAVDGGVITLHLEHYLGIMLLVENEPANPGLDAELIAKASRVLEPFLSLEPPPPPVPTYKVLRPKLGLLRLIFPVLLRQVPLALIAMWLLFTSSSPEDDPSKAWAGSLFGSLVLLLTAYRLARGIYQRTSLIVDPAGKAKVAGVNGALHTPQRVVIRCDFARVLSYRTFIVYENGTLLVARHHDGKQDRQQACELAAYLGVSAYHESRSRGRQKIKAPA
ncbi:hypothetical protein [Pseudomonas californiensis]|uniref:hypothetical protein n=1 Tax=Pseudomonas californiensis TaxID=2829823 RepID=UPI001E3C4A80|nr:hypothetical protein [Pseudomonas californiensis]